MKSGIYIIKNIANDKVYIGQSRNIHNRIREHKSTLRNNNHRNERMQNSWNKYGEENFIFDVLEAVEPDELDEKEIYWIQHFNSSNRDVGFNIESGGSKNKTVPMETRRKISQNHSDVSGKNNPFYGKKHSKETIEKIKNRSYDIGESHPNATLTEKDVLQIKIILNKNELKVTEIANMFGVKVACISKIKHGKTWSHVTL